LRNSGIVLVQILAAKAECYEGEQHECISSHGDGPLPGTTLDAAIEKRKRDNREGEHRWNHQNADKRGRTMPVFQPLENREVIPFWTWDVLRIGGVGRRAELHGREEAQ